MAVRRGARVGVDVESLDRPVDAERMGRMLSAQDRRTLMAVPPHRRQRTFLDVWTLKESYTKARGLGLRLPLDGFGVVFPAEGLVQLNIDDGVDEAPQGWHLWLAHLASGHTLALCTDRVDTGVPALVIQHIAPFAWRRDIELQVLRQSAPGLDSTVSHARGSGV